MLRSTFQIMALQLCIVFVPLSSEAQELALVKSDFVESPPGFKSACLRYEWLCGDDPEGGPARSEEMPEEALLRAARAVNRSVNHSIRQVSDVENHGTAELWALPEGGRGDCEDIAMEKMWRLLQQGAAPDRLSMAIALDRKGNNHAVLLVRARHGYLVLDSLTDRIVGPGETGYRMLAMQASENRGRWMRAEGIGTNAVSARIAGLQGGGVWRQFTSAVTAANER